MKASKIKPALTTPIVALISNNGGLWLRHRSGKVVFLQNDGYVEENAGTPVATLEEKLRQASTAFTIIREGEAVEITF